MSMTEPTINKLTVYKLNNVALNSVTIPSYRLVAEDTWNANDKTYPYRLFFHKRGPFPAPWLSVFLSLPLNIAAKDLPQGIVSGFILLIHVENSVYALTGGVGHIHLGKHLSIEHRFGIELAQRILAIPELRGLSQRDTSGVVNALDRVFRGPYNPHGDINNLKRVLTHVRGTLKKQNPRQATIGRSISASDALTVNGRKQFSDIVTFLVEVERLMKHETPRISIPQLEHINKKHHNALLSELESAMVEKLRHYNADETHTLFLDNEDIGYLPDRVVLFELIYKRRKIEAVTFVEVFEYVRSLLSDIPSKTDRQDAFRRMNLRLHFDDGVMETRRLAYFLCGDLEFHDDVYFLNNELWYRASDEFIKLMERELDNIECLDPSVLGLEEWDKNKYQSERDFNAAHKNLVVMDRRLVKIADEKGGIEFCDLLRSTSDTVELIHVKHDTGAALRALFAQGFVSAKLYAESNEFRTKIYSGDVTQNSRAFQRKDLTVLKSLNKRHRREIRVVFAIFDDAMSHSVAPATTATSKILKGTLSTFAKVDLLDRVTNMRTMGYGVALSRIKPYPKK
ncbi:MAG: hypothetical protein F4201_01705 [Nitrospira sp. SB0677_bin_15]|nr:hypothetical protein [Nitrospira sp. SB0661_bin_20]MYG39531.1 hypothetical protein [Nitrospira sp. SB0677_bin_15]MYJ21994.1 hypothetical protein [Nitrospira sp. SB0673_bin_12]